MTSRFAEHLEDLLAPIAGVRMRKMFGGIGVFRDGIMFGLVADEVLYLKADETTSPGYAAENCGPFVYQGMGREVAMPYWRLPDGLYDDADDFRAWAEAAVAVARRTAKPKKAKRPAKKAAAKAKTAAKRASRRR